MKYSVYAVYPGNDDPDGIDSFKSIEEAIQCISECCRMDKEEGLAGVHYFWTQEAGEVVGLADMLKALNQN